MSQIEDIFSEFDIVSASPDDALVVAVDGFEGPLDLLLALARNQKVDLAKISVLALADQYLAFIESARKCSLELAADYLVMAAWLAYLKSRLLLPQPAADGEPTADEMASALRWRLQRLQVLRETAARLVARNRLNREVFARGAPEPVNVIRLPTHIDTLYDLLTAYSRERLKRAGGKAYAPVHAPVLLIEEARVRLERMLGRIGNWSGLSALIPFDWSGGQRRRSALASMLLACLELVRDGKLEIRQLQPFDEVYLKARAEPRTVEAAS
ncbi:MAG TPA: ScpA family protein [Rhizomicrobium sp.]